MPYIIASQTTLSVPCFNQDVVVQGYLIDVDTLTTKKSEAKVFEYHNDAVDYLKEFFDYKYSEQHDCRGATVHKNGFLYVANKCL